MSCWKSNSLEVLAGQALVSGKDREPESTVPVWQCASLEQLASKELVSGARAVSGTERDGHGSAVVSVQGSLDSLEDRALVSEALSKARYFSLTAEEAGDEEQEAAAAGEEPECEASIHEQQLSGEIGESMLVQKHPESERINIWPAKAGECCHGRRNSDNEDENNELVLDETEKRNITEQDTRKIHDSIKPVLSTQVGGHEMEEDVDNRGSTVAEVSDTMPNSSKFAINLFLGEIPQPMAGMSSLVGLNTLRHLVSGDKRRLQEGRYDLDLTYITRNVIAMSMPAESITSLYRYGLVQCHHVRHGKQAREQIM
jgi:hypothetical protein